MKIEAFNLIISDIKESQSDSPQDHIWLNHFLSSASSGVAALGRASFDGDTRPPRGRWIVFDVKSHSIPANHFHEHLLEVLKAIRLTKICEIVNQKYQTY